MRALNRFDNLKSSISSSFDISSSIVNDATIRRIKSNELQIKSIAEKHNHKKKIEFPDIGIIYRKFFEVTPQGEEILEDEFNTKRKVRKLANSLTYQEQGQTTIIESQYFDLALKLLSSYFNRNILNALFITILEKWTHPNVQKIIKLINERRKSIKNKSRVKNTLNEKSKYFFSKAAHNNLFNDINKKNIRLMEICNFLHIHDSCIRYQYFSVFIVYYTNKKIKKFEIDGMIEEVFTFLEKHDNIETNKSCLAKIIIYAEEHYFNEDIRMNIINFCFRNIGDPSIEANWLPWTSATKKDKEEIIRAQDILNQWLAKKFIYLFFEKIAMDNDRRDFWMQYIKHISNFKIYLESYSRNLFFSRNSEIDSDILKSKIGLLENSGGYSAFILQIKDYLIVEFSQTGSACYIYHNSNIYKPILSKKKYRLSELKHITNRELAVRVNGNSDWYSSNFSTNIEGRLMHSGDWQYKFKYWIKYYLEI